MAKWTDVQSLRVVNPGEVVFKNNKEAGIMTMITLDDAMKVLADNEFLDPKWKSNPEDNDYDPADPYPLVRSELEQKSFLCMRTDTEIKTFQSYLASFDPQIIAHHIAAGDLKEWTRYIRVQGTMTLESLLRDNGGK